MTAFIQRRLLLAIPTVFAVSAAVFLMLHLIPGDPASIYLGDNLATPERLEAIRHEMGLDRPIYIQYLDFVGRALQGDLGRSLQNGRPVALELSERLPRTAELAAAAFIVSVVFGVSLGILSALRHNTWVDTFGMLVALAGVSMPIFWLGLLAILVFSIQLSWFPVTGQHGIASLVLPAMVLGIVSSATLARLVRSSMLEVLRHEYVTTARAKGLRERVVVRRHAFKNALIPVVTVLGLEVGSLLSGAVITETVFARPGIGKLIVDSIQSKDFTVVQGGVLFVAVVYVVVNLAVDVSYGFLDPRIRVS
ncbi:MAG TPA: nickel ABC transporter permease [Candidatus Limnocylindria bacterium]|nr:nickel ABC transporter permease [Candidatus Limnocylindria bacterium]